MKKLLAICVVAGLFLAATRTGYAGNTVLTVDFESDPLPYVGASLTQGGYSLTPASGTMSATRVDSSTGEVHSGSYAASLVVCDADPDGPYVRINRPSSDYIELRDFVSISWWTRVQDGADEASNYVTIGLDPDEDAYNDLWVVSVGETTDTGSDGWVQKTVSLTSLCHVAAYDDGGSYQFGGRGDLGPTTAPTHSPAYASGDYGPIGDLFSIGYANAIPLVAPTDYGHLGINAFYVGCSEPGPNDNKAWFVDDMQIQVVPEPATLGLLLIGGLALLRRRRA